MEYFTTLILYSRRALLEESALVQKILEGDEAAQTLFYKQHAPRLYPICVHFLGYKDADAEDIVQETFLLALKNLKDFQFRSSLYTWLARICVNLCYQQIRKRDKLLVSLQEDLEELSLPLCESQAAEKDEAHESRLRLKLLDRLSQSMNEKCRKVIQLRDREGVSYIQIARTLKVPIGTVMSQLARCREALKRLVQNELEERPG